MSPRQIDQLRRCEIIKEQEVKALCAKARYYDCLVLLLVILTQICREIFIEESNVQRIDPPVTVKIAYTCNVPPPVFYAH